MTAVPYARRSFSGGAIATTIPTGLGASDTSFTVALATNWPSGSGGDFYVDVDRGLPTEEKILCSTTSSLVVTVASGGRGADGTSAVAHNPGCTVQVVHVGQDDDEANQAVNQLLGQPSAAKGDILAMLSAAGPNTMTRVPIGTSIQVLGIAAGLPAWETPANGYGITGFAANPMTPAVALTSAAGVLGSPVGLSQGANTKIMDTASLAVGTWLVIFNAVLDGATASSNGIGITVVTDTATCTITGTTSAEATVTTSGQEFAFSLAVIAVVTVAGTIKLLGNTTGAGGANALATGNAIGFAPVTGYTALRIA